MVEDFREADLRNKKHLCTLSICFTEGVSEELKEDEMDEENDLELTNLMDVLEPHRNLKNLEIYRYKGSKLAWWISSSLFHLRSIELWGFQRLQSLPSLGKLPCLENIFVGDMKALQFVGREFLGITCDIGSQSSYVGFLKLKKLSFESCPNWKEWEDITVDEECSASVTLMPCLTELSIGSCGSLTALPERLLGKKASALEYLEIGRSDDLIKRYKDSEGVRWEWGRLRVPFGAKYGHLQSN